MDLERLGLTMADAVDLSQNGDVWRNICKRVISTPPRQDY